MGLNYYPESSLKDCGFEAVKDYIAALCRTKEAKKIFREKKVLTDFNLIQKHYALYKEVHYWIEKGWGRLPYLEHFAPIHKVLSGKKLYLDKSTAVACFFWLKDLLAFAKRIRRHPTTFPAFWRLVQPVLLLERLQKVFSHYFTDEGQWQPHILEQLEKLSKAIHEVTLQLHERMAAILEKAQKQGLTTATQWSVRNNRLVIPIDATHKTHFKGILHGISRSGQTLYFEPLSTVPLQNRLQYLDNQYWQFLHRQLNVLTHYLRKFKRLLWYAYALQLQIEFAYAKYQWAKRFDAIVPQQGNVLNLRNAYNPELLLYLPKEKIVPLSLTISSKRPILIFSGPNAGGKSMAMKCIVLCQLLYQSGIPVPVDKGSAFPIFKKLFVWIGDQQMVSENLSSFSAHLKYLNSLCSDLDKDSFFIIDEIGRGTAPEFGAALAAGYLHYFAEKGAWGATTTHFAVLKQLGEQPPFLNVGLQFDIKRMRPTFQAVVGVPGNSYAFELARRLNTPPQVLSYAQQWIDPRWNTIESLLQRLKEKEKHLIQKEERLQQQQKRLEEQRKRFLQQQRHEAKEQLKAFQKELMKLYETYKKQQGKPDKVIKESHLLLEQHFQSPMASKTAVEFSVGDKVQVEQRIGEVVAVEKDKVIVQIGNMRLPYRPERLKKVAQPLKSSPKITYNAPSIEIDVRGLRIEEALKAIDQWLNRLLIQPPPYAIIVHGKGTGALKKAIHTFIQKNYPHLRLETSADGGSTKVYFPQ